MPCIHQVQRSTYLLAGEQFELLSLTYLYSVHLCHLHDMFPHASLLGEVQCQSETIIHVQ